MKRLTLLFLLVALFQPVFCNEQHKDSKSIGTIETTQKNSLKIGYFVHVEKCGEIAELKTESLEKAEMFIRSFYPYFCEDFEYEFQYTPYYMVNAYEKKIYCEKMRINKRGKYKRLKINEL